MGSLERASGLGMTIDLYEIRLLFRRELKAALRERGVVINSLLVPLLLYPVLLWFLFSILSFVRGQEEQLESRILLRGLSSVHSALREDLENQERLSLIPDDGPSWNDVRIDEALRGGDLDLFALARPATGADALLEDNFTVEIRWNSVLDRSRTAERRFSRSLDAYRALWSREEALAAGLASEGWFIFATELENVAGEANVGAFLLGLMVPMLMVFMIAIGCFYPAIDTTAGERERSTWETLMASGAGRGNILVAKYLYVTFLGTVAGMLNLFAMTLSMRALLVALLGGEDAGIAFRIPWSTLPVLVAATVLIALMIGALMMLFAVFARTFKEGQAMISPVYMLVLLPPLLVLSPDLELTVGWALVPLANVTLLFRQAIGGQVDWLLLALVTTVQISIIALLLAVSRWVLTFEEVHLGSSGGSLPRLLRERFLRRRSNRDAET